MDKETKDGIWKLTEKKAKEIQEKFPDSFKFNENSKFVFMQKFDNYVEEIKETFMHSDVVDLDSHKIATAIICAIIEAEVIKVIYVYDEDNLVFNGNEKIAVDIGLSYMRFALKRILENTKEAGKFDDYIFPQAFMCDTDYETILCRNLYYAKKYYKLNPIDLANTLFLLENISLRSCGIDLEVVREQCQKLSKSNH